MSVPKLDFIVIGVQKGGTTSLWQYLRQHQSILMPDSKEEPFFSTDAALEPGGLESFTRDHFDSPTDQLLGKATPPYMLGSPKIDVAGIAERIARTLPDVRLIALLRDPIDRAYSQWRMSVRQGFELRSFDEAVRTQLEPGTLVTERSRPSRTNSYVVAGEYGRILTAYRARFPAEQMLIELSADLDNDPEATLDRVLEFLGLPVGYRPPGLAVRHNRGGRRLDGLGEAQLFEFLELEVWPRIGEDEATARREFKRFYEEWSAIPQFPGSEPPPIPTAVRERLHAHYVADTQLLGELEIAVPWTETWKS